MNAPSRHELFVLPDGVKKVTMTPETKILNAATFTIELEDHTLGNILRYQLLNNPDVLFAGYRVPHPLEYKIELKIQTKNRTTPAEALQQAIQMLIADFDCMEEKFLEEVNRFKSDISFRY